MEERCAAESLPRQLLEEVLEPEMARQYRLRRGAHCRYMPVFGTHSWLCSCGKENALGETCSCGLEPEKLTRQVLEELSREAEVRLEQEDRARQAREEALRREAAEKKRKRRIRIGLLCLAGLLVLALVAVGIWLYIRFGVPAKHYRRAMAALEEQDYPLAHRELLLAGDHKDAKARLTWFYIPVAQQRITVTDLKTDRKSGTLLTFGYDETGRLVSTREEALLPDSKGQLTGTGEVREGLCVYNENGDPLVIEDRYGRTEYTYNEQGDVLTQNEYVGEVHDSTRSFIYTYDEKGRVIRSVEVCSELVSVNYSYEQTDIYTYDQQGRVKTQITMLNNPAATENNFTSETEFFYDEKGRLVESRQTVTGIYMQEMDCVTVEIWVYDEQGRQVYFERRGNYTTNVIQNTFQSVTTQYGGQGNLLEETKVYQFPEDPLRDYTISLVNTYDGEGNLVRTEESETHADPQRQVFSGYRQVVEYTYDKNDRCTAGRETREYENTEKNYTVTWKVTYRKDGTPEKWVEAVEYEDPDLDDYTQTTLYNENGLPKQTCKNDGAKETVTDYSYSWFYLPDGVPESHLSTVYYG